METNEDKSGKTAPEHSKPILDRVLSFEEYNKDLKERLEKEHKAKLINFEELITIAPEFAVWLKSIVRYGNVDSQVLIYWDIREKHLGDSDINRFFCYLFTNEHRYHISGYQPTAKSPRGYLGCIATTRKSRVGEDWNRGNDLPDGPYSKETFESIVRGILSYEIKNLQLWRTS